jgi:hypothetical protein
MAKGFYAVHLLPNTASLNQMRPKDDTSSAVKENRIVLCDVEELPHVHSALVFPLSPSPHLFFSLFLFLLLIVFFQFADSSVVVVAMGYARPNAFETDHPACEFLRKPVKEHAFVRCLREVWGKLEQQQQQQNKGNASMQRISSGGLQRVSSGNLQEKGHLGGGLNQVVGRNLPLSILIAEGISLLPFLFISSVSFSPLFPSTGSHPKQEGKCIIDAEVVFEERTRERFVVEGYYLFCFMNKI